nr:hypothetical protein XACLG97_970001 [Xanthomonas citri pv. citri]
MPHCSAMTSPYRCVGRDMHRIRERSAALALIWLTGSSTSRFVYRDRASPLACGSSVRAMARLAQAPLLRADIER